MASQMQEELFEAMLKAAAMEVSLKELESYPPEEVIQQTIISKACDQKARKLMKRYNARDRIRSLGRISRKAVAAAVIAVSIAIGGLYVYSPEVRAAVRYAITTIYEYFVEIRGKHTDDKSDEEKQYEPGYLPDGYKKDSEIQSPLFTIIKYENDSGDQIEFMFMTKGAYTMQIDNKGYEVSDCSINSYEGLLFTGNDGTGTNQIFWTTGEASFCIRASLEAEELKKIAENIHIQMEC